MADVTDKAINQILLSPIFLLSEIMGTFIPGALMMALLCLKGNYFLERVWFNSPFGYKTKIVVFSFVAVIIGKILRATVGVLLLPFLKTKEEDVAAPLKDLSPLVRQMIVGLLSEGVIFATPGLADSQSVKESDALLHLGIGSVCLIASGISGDGWHLRCLEFFSGLVMLILGLYKAKDYQKVRVINLGIGLASVLGSMNPQQVAIAASVVKVLNLNKQPPTVSAPVPAEANVETATNP